MRKLVIGVDVSRNRSGGAQSHILGLLAGADPRSFGIERVHLWAYEGLAARIPDYPWLVLHSPGELRGSLAGQLWWQFHKLPVEARSAGCDVLFNTDAGSVCRFSPAVTLSQDMLSFEPGEMRRYGLSKAWIRLFVLRHVQAASLRRSSGTVFLTDYAKRVIRGACGLSGSAVVINHGVGPEFKAVRRPDDSFSERPIRCLYVSNAAPYKHQWHVVDAIARVRHRGGINATLTLVGGGSGRAQRRLDQALKHHDPDGAFASQFPFVPNSEIPAFLANADVFIFASSCENMPITLMEAMASGLPIACSDRGPMPEVLRDAGLYFDPESPASIADAVLRLCTNPDLRSDLAEKASQSAAAFSWEKCSTETWQYLSEVGRSAAID